MLTAIVACLLLSADGPPVDAVVVAPREFLPALQPLVEHRQRQGHRFAHVANAGSTAEINAGIRQIAAGGWIEVCADCW